MTHRAPADLTGQRVVVVGGGVFGTTHAYMALSRGATVVHLERDAVPVGASVRNFGLVWVSGRAPGRETEIAQRARDLWQEIGTAVPGVGFRANGSLTLLRDEAEIDVARAALSRDLDATRGFSLLTRGEVLARNPAVRGDYVMGLHCARDAAVESRRALGALRQFMNESGRYRYHAPCEMVDLDDRGVRDHRGEWHRGDRVIICVGAYVSGLARDILADQPLEAVRLQMAETSPLGEELTTSVANGDSFRYYPQFRPDAHRLAEQAPSAAHYRIQLLIQQRRHGGLTIGDTHEAPDPAVFDAPDRPIDMIWDIARGLVGPGLTRVERRWTGVYHQLSASHVDEVYLRRRLARDVTLVTGAGGRGMTLAPAIAEESFDRDDDKEGSRD